MGIRDELRQRVLIPLCFGFCITSILGTALMGILIPRWIQEFKTQVITVEKDNLQNIASSLATVFGQYEQRISNDLLSLETMYKKIYDEDLKVSPYAFKAYYEPKYIINERNMSMYAPANLNFIGGFDLSTNTALLRSGWYVGEPLNLINYNKYPLPSTLLLSADEIITERLEWSLSAELYLQTVYNTTEFDAAVYRNVYTAYENGGYSSQDSNIESGGLIYTHPFRFDPTTYNNFVCSDSQQYFDFRCRSWYKDLVYTTDNTPSYDILFDSPYVRGTNEIDYTACLVMKRGVIEERRITCFDINLDSIIAHINSTANRRSASYYILDKSDDGYKPLYHPSYNTVSNLATLDTETGIVGLEYDSNSAEGQTFLNTLVASFATSAKDSTAVKIIEYQKNGTKMSFNLFSINLKHFKRMLAYFDVPLILSTTNDSVVAPYTLCLSVKESDILASYVSLSDEVNQRLLIQIFTACAILILLLLCAWPSINYISLRFIRPLEDLTKLLNYIENPDLEFNDSLDNSKPREKGDIKQHSYEINTLYRTFHLIKTVVNHAKSAQKEQNSALALMHYAKILSIYNKLGNKRGAGIVHNNLGNIHLKSDRLDEALIEYRNAVRSCEEELKELKIFRKKLTDPSDDFKLNFAKITNKKVSKPNLLLLDEIQVESQHLLSNRLFQLANCLIIKAHQSSENKGWNEIIEVLTKVMQHDNETGSSTWRLVYCSLEMVEAYIEAERLYVAQQKLQEAEESIKNYEQIYDTLSAEAGSIPVDILKQRFYYCKGRFCKQVGKKKEACLLFTSALENGRVFDPMVRKQSLQELLEIFKSQNLDKKAENVGKLLSSYIPTNKDIIFLLDYSQSMNEGSRISLAVQNILKIFDNYVKPKDRVGLIRFNMNCDIVFGLSEADKNIVQLRKQIEDSLKPSGGTAFYTALNEALKIFHKADRPTSNKWIIALTDGDDNESRVKFEEILRKLYKSTINLVVIGLGLHQAVIPKLSVLCRATNEGIFIDSPSNEDLEAAFQAAADVIYGQYYIVENIGL